MLTSNRNEDDIYGIPDTLISRQNPCIAVSNFSNDLVRISKGQLMGNAHEPQAWLDQHKDFSPKKLEGACEQVRVLSTLINRSSPTVRSLTENLKRPSAIEDITEHLNLLAEPPVEGGPKTAELPPGKVEQNQLLTEVDICTELSKDQRMQLEQIILKNEEAFGLDGRLGNYAEKVEVPLLPNAQPVSLPPIPLSPANRESMGSSGFYCLEKIQSTIGS
ncbi:hypothetical protein F5051DRAFT_463792 [Lentinula edodes]|nr:hypothetical protein F5051DRAFT_463792 [Lentinula edodes]